MKYLDDKRRKLTGQETVSREQRQTVQKPDPGTPAKVQTPVQQSVQPAQVQNRTQEAAQTAQTVPAAAQTQIQAQTQTVTPSAAQQAQQLLSQQPGAYQSKWGSTIEDVLEQLMNPKEFTYDPNTDPLYLLLRDQYARDGKLAMEDTMGQAAQLTGGYGNSHAQMLGQQTYQGYMRGVNDLVPELRDQARADYDAQNDALLQKLGLMMDQDEQDYGRYLDEIERQRYDEETAYARGQEAYDRLAEIITSTGYTPTAEELAAAGMTEDHAKAWKGYYDQSVGSGSGVRRTSDDSGIDDGKPKDGNTVIDQYIILAGNGVSKEELLASADEDLSNGEITQEEYDELAAWIDSLDDNPNEPVKNGYTGRGARDLGRDLHTRD